MTWASESDLNETDKMSEDGVSSTGLSDEGNASLVGFGETASSVSGPVSNSGRAMSGMSSAMHAKQHMMRQADSPMEGVELTSTTGQDQAERKVGERADYGNVQAQQPLNDADKAKGLGKPYYEGK